MNKFVNEIIINFDYYGQMICELKIKIVASRTSCLSHSNKIVNEIEKICESKDK